MIKHPEAKDKKGLIDYNVHVFQDAITEVFARKWEKRSSQADNDNVEQAAGSNAAEPQDTRD